MTKETKQIKVLDGITRTTLCYGDKTLMTEFRLQGGRTLPMHNHPEEQTGYLVSGHIILIIGNEQVDTYPGDAWVIPCHVSHGAKILEDSVAIEVFSPVRADYLP